MNIRINLIKFRKTREKGKRRITYFAKQLESHDNITLISKKAIQIHRLGWWNDLQKFLMVNIEIYGNYLKKRIKLHSEH